MSYVLHDWTSHLLLLCNLNFYCVGLDEGKGNGLPNKSWRLKQGMKSLESTFTLNLAERGLQVCQLHTLYSLYTQGNSLAIISVRGWMDPAVLSGDRRGKSLDNFSRNLNELRQLSPPWILVVLFYYCVHCWTVSLRYLFFCLLWHSAPCATDIAIGTEMQSIGKNWRL